MNHVTTIDILQLAKENNIQSFLQSLFIHLEENKDYQVIPLTDHLFSELGQLYSTCEKVIAIHDKYFMGITHWSATHQHNFSSIFVCLNQNQNYERIDFLTFIKKIFPLWMSSPNQTEHQELFISRVKKSIDETSTLLKEKWDDLQNLFQNEQVRFEIAEGILPFGHYAHPYPKLQEKIDHTIDYHFNQPTEIIWCLVDKNILELNHAKSLDLNEVKNHLVDLYTEDYETDNREKSRPIHKIPKNYLPLPIHSYQWEILKSSKDPSFLEYINQNKIIIAYKNSWYPTTSTRALYSPQKKWMLKFSLSIRITNSIRILQKEEVNRGMQLTDVLNTPMGQELKIKLKNQNFKIIEEPFYLALKKLKSDEIIKETIVVFRENPFQKNPSSHFSLATLNQRHPTTNKALLSTYLKKHQLTAELWYESYLAHVVKPILSLQTEFGVYLGAHQQNVIVSLDKKGLIQGAYYRDCQGTGYNDFFYQIFFQNINGSKNLLTTTFANQLITYYFFVNSTLGTIKSLADQNSKLEEKLILRTTHFLSNYKIQIENNNQKEDSGFDLSLINELLTQNEITIKNNFICCLQNINENTIENPLSIYRLIKNPFKLKSLTNQNTFPVQQMSIARFHGNAQVVYWDDFYIWLDPDHKYQYLFDSENKALFYFIENKPKTVIDNSSIEEALFNRFPAAQCIHYLSQNNKLKKTLFRSEFFQNEEIWEQDIAKKFPLDFNLTTKGKIPKRPKYSANTILYKRYIYSIKKTLSIRVIDILKDLETFHHWHHQPRVANFWELNKSKAELAEYIRTGLADPHQISVIIELDGEAVGYFEIYWTFEDRLAPFYEASPFDRGIHLLIGNTKYLGKENTDAILKSVCHYIFLADPRTERIMGEPRIDNDKILKYLLLFNAWKKIKEFDFPHKRAALVECSRKRFFQGGHL